MARNLFGTPWLRPRKWKCNRSAIKDRRPRKNKSFKCFVSLQGSGSGTGADGLDALPSPWQARDTKNMPGHRRMPGELSPRAAPRMNYFFEAESACPALRAAFE